MVTKRQRKYVVDENGRAVSVLLDIRSYREMLDAMEELECIRAYDAAKASRAEAIPFAQAVHEIEKSRR